MSVILFVIIFGIGCAWVGNRIADEWYAQLERGDE